MKTKILSASIMAFTLSALCNGSLQAAAPAGTPPSSAPGSGFVNGGTAGQSAAPVNDSNVVPGYDMPPAYPATPGSTSVPGSTDGIQPPAPPSDMPYDGTDTNMVPGGTTQRGNGMTPPPPRPSGMGRQNGPGPAGMPPPADSPTNMNPPQDGGPSGNNMLPPAQTNGVNVPPSSKNKKTPAKLNTAAKSKTKKTSTN